LDTGASHSFVNVRTRNRLLDIGAQAHPLEGVQVEFGKQGARSQSVEYIAAQVAQRAALGRVVYFTLHFLVLDLTEDVECILGYPDLRAMNLFQLPQRHQWLDRPGVVGESSMVDDGQEAEEAARSNEYVIDSEILAVPPEIHAQFEGIRTSFADVMSEDLPRAGARLPPFRIDLIEGQMPERHRPIRMAPALREILRKECEKLERDGIIRPSRSPFAARAFLVYKDAAKKTEPRKVCDYTSLNKVTQRVNFPMPNAQDVIARLRGSKYFARLDLRRGFWQVLMAPDCIAATAFITPDGAYEYLRAPMGTMNLPQHFARVMLEAFKDMQDFVIIFVDDAFLYAETIPLLKDRLTRFLERSRELNLRWSPRKCVFGATRIECLSFIVDGKGVEIQAHRRQGINAIKKPADVTGLRSFMGLPISSELSSATTRW
jgi:hypothetical protein